MTSTAVLPLPSVAGISQSDLALTPDRLARIGALLATELLSNALATCWGTRPAATGKTVWCFLT